MVDDKKYLRQLSYRFPNIISASEEIINLEAILNLPKGTEHYISDIHGEYEAFVHVLKNASGTIRNKIEDAFGDSLSEEDKNELATIIYYPKEKIPQVKKERGITKEEYKILIDRLVIVCRLTASKYTKSKVRKAMNKGYAYILEELMTTDITVQEEKTAYYNSILDTIVNLGTADEFIVQLSILIQKMAIDKLHIIGDIFDRGPGPHFIMDYLDMYKNYDVQWGNHDVVWMGAALGSMPCISNIVRNSLRYDSLDIIQDGYGINMMPLATFASDVYKDDPCVCYKVKGKDITQDSHMQLTLKMHKAISIIQWKTEGHLIMSRPEFDMDDRLLLNNIDYSTGIITIDGHEYELLDKNYPTIDPNDPYKLTEREREVCEKLSLSFARSEKLMKHAMQLVKKGALYQVTNDILMYHGCVPFNKDGSFREVSVFGKKYKGKELMDVYDSYCRKAFLSDDEEERKKGVDILWYLWNAPGSPIFGKNKMATLERYLLTDKEPQKEVKDYYYKLVNDETIPDGDTRTVAEIMALKIFEEFGLDKTRGKILNGHVPVKQKDGENPVKANSRLIFIDGGFSKSYHKETGIAGYTYIFNSKGTILVAHKAFESTEQAISSCEDIVSQKVESSMLSKRILVGDTDVGRELKEQIEDLKLLIRAYKDGVIKENGFK